MDDRTKLRCFRWSTYIGCFLTLGPSFLPWYWGNLSVYTDSYFRATLGPDSGYDTSWTISLFMILEVCAINLFGFIRNHLSNHKSILFTAFVVYNSTMFLSYLAIQKSVTALILTTGPTLGFCFGVIFSHVLYTMKSWCTFRNVGFYLATVITANNIGPFCVIQMVTHYINPNNKQPSLIVNERAYFTQQDILDRVPKVFIVLGIVSLSCHVCGYLLTRDIKHATLIHEDKDNSTSKRNISKKSRKDNATVAKFTKNVEENCCHNSTDGAQEELKSAKEVSSCNYGTSSNIDEEAMGCESNSFRMESVPQIHSDEIQQIRKHDNKILCPQTDTDLHDLSPKQALRTCSFYVMCFCIFCSDICFLVVTNFYKIYGQSRISDDHFLANAGTVALICIFITRPMWGMLVDHLGSKDTLVLFTSSVSLGSVFWFFTPLVNKWFYLVWTALFASANGGFFVVFPSVVLKIFGSTYHLSNYGLIMTGSVIANVAGPSITGVILSNFGFFGLFCTMSILAAISLMSVVLFFPRCELY